MSLPEQQISLQMEIEKLNQEGLWFGPTGLPLPDAQGFDNTKPMVLTPLQQYWQALYAKIEAERHERRRFR